MTKLTSAILCLCLLSAPQVHADPGAESAGKTEQFSPKQLAFFEKHVRPLLAEQCWNCHGPEQQESGLRLDSRAAVLAGGDGGLVVVPGRPAESELIRAVRHFGRLQMPPDGMLTPPQIAALEKWVKAGLPWPKEKPSHPDGGGAKLWQEHWSFQPIADAAVPEIANDEWSRTPIDRFIFRRLRERGVTPSPAAADATLLRRVTYDLLGLPPAPGEAERFLNDGSPAAYRKLVDRLLASPHYGERWGRHWLDVARYADHKGYVFFEEKTFPWAYAYRDYVIEAFNADLPYDRFVLEQLAADQLDLKEDRTPLAGMGFLTVGGRFMNNVHDILDDRIDVVTRGLLGLTVTCARCHDHKFDPIPQTDYYALYGVFRSSVEPIVPPLFRPPPETDSYREFDRELTWRMDRLDQFITAKHRELIETARSRAAEYLLAAHARRDQPPTDDFMLITGKGELNPAMIVRWQHLLDRTRRRPDRVWRAWHALAALENGEDFAAASAAELARLRAENAAVNPLVLDALEQSPLVSLAGVAERYARLLNEIDREWQALVVDAAARKRPTPARLPDADREELRRVFYGAGAPPDIPLMHGWGFLSLLPDRPSQAEYQNLRKAVESYSSQGPHAPPRAMVLVDAAHPHEPRVFQRGDPNRPGEAVPRRFLSVLDPQKTPFTEGSGRLELARAIVDPKNPLTARVIVNRVWLHHFGSGLVTTPSDFGLRGELPSYPELLDYLAAELVRHDWSLKWLHRDIVDSAVYRQSSLERPGPARIDPANRLLWRMNRRRLGFEGTRDALIAVSGSLDESLHGPPVDLLPGFENRRALYGFVNRLDLPGLFTAFDFPNPAASSPQRNTTTVAPQALFLMNNALVAEAARRLLARPDVASAQTPRARCDAIYRIVFARRPREDERKLALSYLGEETQAGDWHQFVHALLMTNEFVFVD